MVAGRRLENGGGAVSPDRGQSPGTLAPADCRDGGGTQNPNPGQGSRAAATARGPGQIDRRNSGTGSGRLAAVQEPAAGSQLHRLVPPRGQLQRPALSRGGQQTPPPPAPPRARRWG